MKRVLVTGATGFVGRTLCDVLAQSGYLVRCALRTKKEAHACAFEVIVVGDIAVYNDWEFALRDVDVVVHAAGRAHVLNDSSSNLQLYMDTNVEGTQRLARAAENAGIRRFIYLSSIKVNGESTCGRPFRPTDLPNPSDNYGISKWHAEQKLWEFAERARMEVIVIRPPLVYGPGVHANFRKLLSWVHKGFPLPLGCVINSRSMVSVWNLCDLIKHVIQLQTIRSEILLVSDGIDLSTPDLIRRIAKFMDRPICLLPVPVMVLKTLGGVMGKSREVSRLCSSLSVDISATRCELNWTPPMSLDSSLERTVQAYLVGIESNDG
jgi:nucleoside-diphosphate-sugar epimerase